MTSAASATWPALSAPARRTRKVSPHVLLVANSNASGLLQRPELLGGTVSLLRAAGVRVETRVTDTLEELHEALAGAERRVILLGGDGSLHAAANAPGEKPELALIPAGGANNVAHALGVPTDVREAAHLAASGIARPIDLMEAATAQGTYLVVEGVSVGLHALAREHYRGRNSADLAAGFTAGLEGLVRFRPITVGLSVDGVATVARVAQIFAANMPLFGPRLLVAPGADPYDGLLDLVTIEASSRLEVLGLVRDLRRGRHLERPGVRRLRARTVRIAPGAESPVIADTTNLGRGTVTLKMRHDALAVVGGSQ